MPLLGRAFQSAVQDEITVAAPTGRTSTTAPASDTRDRSGGAVRDVGSALPLLSAAQLLVLRRVVGPLRRRFWKVDPAPPPLTGPQILQRVAAMPVSFWTYEFEPGVRHLGPMAQDFAAAFGLGRTNRMIDEVDANGIALTAIQALHRRVVALEAEVERLRRELEGRPSQSPGG